MGTPSSNPPPSLLIQIRDSVSTLNAALTEWTQSASGSSSHSQASTSGARAATPRPQLPPPGGRAQVGVGVPVPSMAGGRGRRGRGLTCTSSSPTPRSSAGQTQHQIHGTPNSAREFRTLFGLSGRGRRNARSTSTAGAVHVGTTGTFFKDVILLDHGQDSCKNKVPLFEAGRVSSSVMFQKAMDEEAIETVVEGLFEELGAIPRPRFEYVKVISHRVLVPQTSRTHTWNGAAIKHHTGQGDLYVRATAPLPMPDLDVGELSEDELPLVYQPTSSSTSPSTSSSPLLPSSSSTPSTSTASPSRTNLRDSSVFLRTYREYVDLIDCGELEVETEGNGMPPIVTHHVPVRLEDSVMLDCLDSWRTAQVDEDAPHFRLSVRRPTLLRNMVNSFKKKEVDPRAPLVVYFVGEAGVDTGGLTRELATLCLPLIRESQYLAGPPGKMVPSQATYGIISGEIQAVGKMLGAVLLHSRLRLPFLNPMLAELIIQDESPWVIGLIPDDGKRESVQKLHHASTEEELTEALDGCTIVDDLGWSKIINIQNKDEVVRAATSHYSYYANKAAIDEFLLGLEFYGAKEFARKNPDCFRSMFGKLEQRLDANMVFDLFKPVYSLDGSNAKNMEEETIMYFIEFLQKCATGDADVSGMTLEELLMFFSGAKEVPLGGFEIQPKLLFTGEMLPHASTCALELTLPMKYGNEKDFINMLVDAIRNTHGFGNV